MPALILVSAACKPDDQSDATTDAQAAADRINDLRSLPYAGETESADGDPDGVVYIDEDRSCPGFNLYSIQMLGRAELIDARGVTIKSWRHGERDRWENCELLPNGDLLVVGADHQDVGSNGAPRRGIPDNDRYLLRMNWSGDVVWKRQITAHHDVELTPDGNLLVLTFARVSVPQIHESVDVRDDRLTLLDLAGATIDSHSMLEGVNRGGNAFPIQKVGISTLGIDPWVDLFHANSVEWMHNKSLAARNQLYDLQNVLVCYRHQDRIAIFNWPSNEAIWSWGHGQLSGPHDAQVLDSGNILLFDNGLSRNWSRAIEVDPIKGDIVWQYKTDPPEDFYTRSKGSVQRLPNGNTLMAESDKGRAIEVTPEGEIVWEFLCPHESSPNHRAAIVRMKRYPRSLVDRLLK